MTAKLCRYGCGVLIEWNDSQKCFVNEGNKQRHDCRSRPTSGITSTATTAKSNPAATTPQLKQPDTITRIAHETALTDIVKAVVDNANNACRSFQFELKITEVNPSEQ